MEKIFDTHAHYFDRKYGEIGSADTFLSGEDFWNAVCGVVNVGTRYENSLKAIEQAKKHENMYVAVGIHPSDAQNDCKLSIDEEIERIRSLVSDEKLRKENKIVAIGEIGFDYYWKPVNKELQYEYFERQMMLAEEFDLPVIIHDREAHGDTFDMIKRFPKVKGVLHSCSMSAEMVREMVKLGWYISFSGVLTYKNAANVKEACLATPLDRLLIETDAPYLSPVPHRGKLNNSVYMQSTAAEAAELHKLSFDEMARKTMENAKAFFKI
ncbi:MAG: TatD family hydrolase [Clostridia bacterium]|nr:TatD family hydrolase [Clostridia bacterium]